jgi:hypothetical protein
MPALEDDPGQMPNNYQLMKEDVMKTFGRNGRGAASPLLELSLSNDNPSKMTMRIFADLNIPAHFQLTSLDEAEDDWYERIALHLPDGVAFMDELTEDRVNMFDKNTTIYSREDRGIYMKFMERSGVKDKIQELYTYMTEGMGTANIAKLFLDWAHESKKFKKWLVPEYGIDLGKCEEIEEAKKREEIEEARKKREEEEPDSPIASRTRGKTKEISGTGADQRATASTKITRVIIPPSPDERLKRIKVIIGSKKANNNADMLEEFTALLDSLLSENRIDEKVYKHLLNQYVVI